MRIFILCFCLFITGCTNEKELLYDACLKEGRQYHRDIGSFPFLTDGRKADDVVKEKCKRSPHIYGEVSYDHSKIKHNYWVYLGLGIPLGLFLLALIMPVKTHKREDVIKMMEDEKDNES